MSETTAQTLDLQVPNLSKVCALEWPDTRWIGGGSCGLVVVCVLCVFVPGASRVAAVPRVLPRGVCVWFPSQAPSLPLVLILPVSPPFITQLI